MTPSPEKAAPIPADDAVDTVAGILASNAGRKYVISGDLELAAEIVEALAAREARPSLLDSREERIRAEAAEDERDRLLELFRNDPHVNVYSVGLLVIEGATFPAVRARARQGGNNG